LFKGDIQLRFSDFFGWNLANPYLNLIFFEQWMMICFGAGANPRLLSPSNSPYTLTHLKIISVRVAPSLKAKATEV
jgi:hypothetical protein